MLEKGQHTGVDEAVTFPTLKQNSYHGGYARLLGNHTDDGLKSQVTEMRNYKHSTQSGE